MVTEIISYLAKQKSRASRAHPVSDTTQGCIIFRTKAKLITAEFTFLYFLFTFVNMQVMSFFLVFCDNRKHKHYFINL